MDDLSRLASAPDEAGLFLDIDGVLAPIVARPEDARVPDETRAELRRLADRYALVAAITGRPSEAGRAIVGVPELRYVGEHGLELAPPSADWLERIRELAAGAAWPDTELKPLSAGYV